MALYAAFKTATANRVNAVPSWNKSVVLIAVIRAIIDVTFIIMAYAVAVSIARPEELTWTDAAYNRLPYLIAFILIWCAAAADQRLFVSRRSETIVALLFAVAKAYFTAALFTAFVLALLSSRGVDRNFYLVLTGSVFVALLIVRLAMGLSLWNLRRRGWNARRILIIGSNERTKHLVEAFLANEHYGYYIDGFIEDDIQRRPILEEYHIPCFGEIENLENILLEHVIDGVYISLPVRSHYETIQSIAHLCEGIGVPVRLLADLFPLRMATSDITRLKDIPLLSLSYEPGMQGRFALNRAISVIVSAILLFIFAPVFLLIAIAIKIDSRGPIFAYKPQHRTDASTTNLLSFRTHVVQRHNTDHDPERQQESTADSDDPATTTSPAPTRVGKFLIRYGLDELPQLVSVFLGKLNFIGAVSDEGYGGKMDSPV